MAVTVLMVAASLAAVSLVLAVALLRERRAQYRLLVAGHLGPWPWKTLDAYAMLSFINCLPLVFFVVALNFRLLFGFDPIMVTNPQGCPGQPNPGPPYYPCDPRMGDVYAVPLIESTWTLIQVAPIWFVVCIGVLLLGRRARRRAIGRATPA